MRPRFPKFSLSWAHLYNLITLSISIHTSQSDTSQPAKSTDPAIHDITYSGLYPIINCNANWPARLQPGAQQLRTFLPEAWNSTRLLIEDVVNGVNSKYGFEALFKTNASIDVVKYTMQSLRNGADVGPTSSVPTMVCLDSELGDPSLYPLYDQICTPSTVVKAIPNSTHIGFCPAFFRLNRKGIDFPIQADCPVATANTIKDSIHPLTHNAYPIFLAQMLHLYMEEGLIKGDVNNQVHHIQDCVNLNATGSSVNIANWVNYAACECLNPDPGCSPFP